MIEITANPDLSEWTEFVYNHSEGNIFQTPEMAEVYKKSEKYDPIVVAATNSNSKILALMLAVRIRHFNGFLSPLSSRVIIQGGPLYVNDTEGVSALKLLIREYNRLIKGDLFTEIRNLWDTANSKSLLKEFGYKYEDHLNYLINLDRSEKEIWSDIHKSRRKGINRASKRGVEVHKLKNKKHLNVFFELLAETYKKVGMPLGDFSLFKNAFNTLASKGEAKFYVAKYEDEIVGSRVVLNYKGFVYDWYAGSSSSFSDHYVNEALVWHILKDHANSGWHTFDFGGAGKPNEEYGPREFKRRFGGRLVNYGRYKKSHSPKKMMIAAKGFKLYRNLKSVVG